MDLFKFPRTKHLFDAGGSGVSRDDLLMDSGEEAAFYSISGRGKAKGKGATSKAGPKGRGEKGGILVAMEEKVDGANLGISVDPQTLEFRVQNRSHFINSQTHRQFGTLDSWLSEHSVGLFKLLGTEPGRYVLFGEWLYATHSIPYTRLLDYFLAFDLYDRSLGAFLSWRERNKRLEGTGIHHVRLIAEEKISSREEARKWLETKSAFYDGPVEGIYFRIDEDMMPTDHTPPPPPPPAATQLPAPCCVRRGKLVRPDFLQGIEEQWTRKQFQKNKLIK